MYDYVIIGAGLAGSVLAERITNVLDKKVLVIEKRNHIGGNCYDFFDENNILVHKYGPHIFNTDSREVWDYISQFTDWHLYQHKVLGFIDGKKVPIPFNLNTLKELLPKSKAKKLERKLVDKFGFNVKIPILDLKEVKDADLRILADFIYKKVFFNYTVKQWEMKPEELYPSVTGRVPVFISHDNRYFQNSYQGIPKEGYTKVFERMLENKNIKILLNTDFKEVVDFNVDKITLFGEKFKGKLIFTGKIDEFFGYEFGELPYRSLRFEFKNEDLEFFQEVGTVNYPNDYDFTRITEFKHLTGQKAFSTTIVKEYPQNYDTKIKGKEIPYYPIPQEKNSDLYLKYEKKAQNLDKIIFVGRLAEYRYYSMADVIQSALNIFRNDINE